MWHGIDPRLEFEDIRSPLVLAIVIHSTAYYRTMFNAAKPGIPSAGGDSCISATLSILPRVVNSRHCSFLLLFIPTAGRLPQFLPYSPA